MKQRQVPTIYVKYGRRKLKIPGGWSLRVPEILQLDSTTTTIYSNYLQRTKGLGKFEAEAEVLDMFTEMLNANWYRMQMLSLRRWAKQYAKAYPTHIQQDGTLKGFDPALFQNVYIPGMNTGRAGKLGVKKLFREMANSTEE